MSRACRDLRKSNKRFNIKLLTFLEGEMKEGGAEKVFEEIMAETL